MSAIDRPVFLVGMPRSGSTVFHRVLSRQPDFATTTNVTRKAPTVYPWLKLLSCWYRQPEPGEAGGMWDRFVTGESDVLRAADATPAARRYYRKAVENCLRLYGKPRFLSKCPRNGLRMGFLQAIFPDARFVHLVRDGRAVGQSILERRKRSGNIRAWWDVKPEGWRTWEAEDPVVAVAHQWNQVILQMQQAAAGLPAGQYLEVRYEDLVTDPMAFLGRVCDFCDVRWPTDQMAAAVAGLENRNDKWAKVFTPSEVERMMAIMGPTMARFGYR